MFRSDTLGKSQVERLVKHLVGEDPGSGGLAATILRAFENRGSVNVDWFLSHMASLAELLGNLEMSKRVGELSDLRNRAVALYDRIEKARAELEQLKLEESSLRRLCRCEFGESFWDGIETYHHCPFCFG